MKHLYIDEQLMDLYPNTVIAQTLQVFDPGRLGSIVTNFTSQIRVPITRTNERILSFLSNSKVKSDVPFTSLSCRYMENGIPVIQNARVVLMYVDQREYVLSIYSGPWGFFEVIQKKTLWDLDFSDINGSWTVSDRDGYRNTTEGLVQALVDDGRLDQDSVASAPTIENQGSTLKSPQIYYHTLVTKIFSSFGFEYEGDIFTNPVFLALAMPLSVRYQDTKWLAGKAFSAGAPGDQEITDPVSGEAVVFDQNVRQGEDNFYDGTSDYVVDNPETTERYFRMIFQAQITIVVTSGTVDIILKSTGLSDVGLPSVTNVGSGTYNLYRDATLNDGSITNVVIETNTGNPVIDVISGVFYNIPFTGITDPDDETFNPNINADFVYFEKLLPEITLVDFLREFCVRFGVQITQINNVLVCNTLNLILDIQTGPDWTRKRDRSPNKISYSIQGYFQENIISVPIDEDFTPDTVEGLEDGTFDIPSENIPESTTIYTSLFYGSEMITTYGVFMLKLNVGPVSGQFERDVGVRLFFVRDKYDHEPPVLYDSVEREDYLIGYAFDPEQEYNMSFQFFIDTFQQKFIDRCLRRVRLLERYYNLSDLDIFSFNQQVPIWDDSERFLVTKISNYISRRLTKVELLKIEPNPEFFFVQGTENLITGELEDYKEIIGDDVEPELQIDMELVESVTGNPTWQTTFNNGSDSDILTTVGNSSSDSGILDPHVGSLSVSANVLKTNNDGNGPDGFPTADGWVEWLRNGIQVNTVTFNTASPSSSQSLNYTYLNVKAWEVLKTIVHEDGTSP